MSEKNTNQFFEDFSKLAGGAMNTMFNSANDIKQNFEKTVELQIEHYLSSKGFVTREEFEVVKDMAAKALEENKKLAKQLKKVKDD